MTHTNCTNIENNIDLTIPILLLTIPCGKTFLCLMSFDGIHFNQTFIQ